MNLTDALTVKKSTMGLGSMNAIVTALCVTMKVFSALIKWAAGKHPADVLIVQVTGRKTALKLLRLSEMFIKDETLIYLNQNS